MTPPHLHLHRAVRSSDLIDGLAALVSEQPLDPFTAEVISVPTPGVERWLGQALSTRLGVAAGIDFLPFGRWMDQVWAAASAPLLPPGEDGDPWSRDRLVRSVLQVLDASAGEEWAAPVSRHVGLTAPASSDGTTTGPDGPTDVAAGPGGRRFLTARRLAGLFHRYHRERPAMVTAWLSGDDVDAAGTPLDRRHRWQAELWRRVRATVGVPSPAERIDTVRDRLLDDPDRFALPARLSVFGLNRLDPLDRAVLQALASSREVHLWLAHPSPGRWDRIAAAPSDELWPTRATHHRAAATPDAAAHGPGAPDPAEGNPLVSQLGRDVVEFQHVISHLDVPLTETVHGALPPPTRVLGHLQHAIAADRPVVGDPVTVLQPGDDSLQVHSCHGPDRQVEVLREVICGLLADRPDLEPRDIMVMCPDLPRFAPLVEAAFDPTGTLATHPDPRLHPGRRLRIRIADQSLTQVNPILGVLERVLDLVNARVTASDLVDLCASGPVAARFGFSADDLERLEHLVRSAGVRWGLGAADRARFGLGGYGQNTVSAGLDRMLLGVAWSDTDHRHLGTVLPLDEVESSDVDLVGRLAELVDRLGHTLRSLTGPHPVDAWVAALQGAVESLTAAEPGEAWQLGHAWSSLQSLRHSDDTETPTTADTDAGAAAHGDDGPLLDLGDLRAAVEELLAGRPSRANFRTGSLTLSSLAPMRSVPHKVICLLGMDDQAFPRAHARDGDDLLAAEPRVGDRDRRSEDRQLLLDAIMAAEDTVVVVHSGRDPRTNSVRPPAVPVGELLDTVAALVAGPDGSDVRDQLVVEHALQPYDARNFGPDTAVRSFDRTALAAARAASGIRTEPTPVFTRTPLPPVPPDPDRSVGLADLQGFFKHPVRAFLRERGRWTAAREEDDAVDLIPLDLDGLQTWKIGDRLLAARRAGADEATLAAAEWRRGVLPPKRLGGAILDSVLAAVDQIHTSAERWRGQPRREVDLRVDGTGWTLTGTATEVHGQALVSVGYSRPGPVQWLSAWWELLALTCTEPDVPWQAVVIGRGRDVVTLGPVSTGFARHVLDDAVALREAGLLSPLPLPPKTGGSYARARRRYGPERALEKAGSDWRFESDELWSLFWGPSLADVTAEPAIDEERRGDVSEPTRFGTLARRVFWPLLGRSEGIR